MKPSDNNYIRKVHDGFARQKVMKTLSAELVEVDAGKVSIRLPFSGKLTQHNGFIHAGIITTVVDSACGYAAFTLMPRDSNVLTIEFKVNFLAPAIADYFIAIGQVIRAGRTISVCEGKVIAHIGNEQKHIAHMQATLMCLSN